MKMNAHIWTILLLCFLGTACTRVETYDLTEDELGFVAYEVGDVFKLKNKETGDVVVFDDISKTDRYREIHKSRWRKDKLQSVHLSYRYSSDGNCGGGINIAKDEKIGNTYSTYFYFNINFSCIEKKGITIKAWGHDAYEHPVSLTIGSKKYDNLYYFENDTAKLYFSKDKGYVKVENKVTDEVFTIVE